MEDKRSIPFARPWLGENEADAARRVILSGWVTQGPEVEAFEREFADYVGARYACAVSSCTTALHLALLAVGVRPGGEVITVSHSFIATANAVRYCGATPVFADVEPRTFNMNPPLIEALITEKTEAILCVHQLGMPCDMKSILEIARRRNIPVVEDSACAIGSQIALNDAGFERIGKPHGDVACFSFHPRKIVTTGDGGMITTNNAGHDRLFRLWRQHGMSVPDTARHSAKTVIFEEYEKLGYNYRMTDIQAAIGREQLKKLPEMIERRRLLARRYHELLSAETPEITTPHEPKWALSNWQSYCARLPEWADQLKVMRQMLDAGAPTRRGVMCAHREKAYLGAPWSCGDGPGVCGCAPGSCRKLAESERAQDRTILLPFYSEITEDDQDYVVARLKEALASARA